MAGRCKKAAGVAAFFNLGHFLFVIIEMEHNNVSENKRIAKLVWSEWINIYFY